MIPNGGYNFDQCYWKDEDKKKLLSIITPIRQQMIDFKMESFWDTKDYSGLNQISFKDLVTITNSWPKKAFELELINFKMAVTREYKLILEFSKKCNEVLKYIQAEKELIEESVKVNYSLTVSQNIIFSDYFSYSDFKKILTEMLSPETLSISKITNLKKKNVFEVIRRKVVSEKANLLSLLTASESNMIRLSQIAKEDKNTERLLGAEFFHALCSETMVGNIPYGKRTHTEIVRPSHSRAKQLKIERTELAYFTISLDPLADVNAPIGDVIEFNSGLKFEITRAQQVVEKEMFYQLKLDSQATCNVLVPIYFSFIRCNLVAEQRSSYKKIETATID